jgi:nucleoside-diphosphate-sugar epimerase
MNNRQKNIWIFGGTGFIGNALVSQLDLNPNNRLFLLLHHKLNFEKYEGLNTFVGSLSGLDFCLLKRYPPDIVFHLARLPGGNVFTRSFASETAFRANRRLAGFLGNLKNPPVVVYVSGSLMYGHRVNGGQAAENDPLKPIAFARYYIRGEQPWIEAQQSGNLDVRFARPGWIIGPSSWFKVFFWNFYLKTGKIPFYGDGNQLMSVVGLEDCVRLIDRLGRGEEKRQNLNVFTIPPITQIEFSNCLAGKLNATVTGIPISGLTRKFGKTVASALTLSIPLSTEYPELYRNFQPVSPDLETMLDATLTVLKNE